MANSCFIDEKKNSKEIWRNRMIWRDFPGLVEFVLCVCASWRWRGAVTSSGPEGLCKDSTQGTFIEYTTCHLMQLREEISHWRTTRYYPSMPTATQAMTAHLLPCQVNTPSRAKRKRSNRSSNSLFPVAAKEDFQWRVEIGHRSLEIWKHI